MSALNITTAQMARRLQRSQSAPLAHMLHTIGRYLLKIACHALLESTVMLERDLRPAQWVTIAQKEQKLNIATLALLAITTTTLALSQFTLANPAESEMHAQSPA